MSRNHFPRSILLSWLAITTFSTPAWSDAKDLVTPAVGYLRFDCLPASDTPLSVPFQRPSRWSGKLAAAPVDQGGGTVRLTLTGSPAFANGELTAAPHLLLSRAPAGAIGRHFAITAHSAASVDLAATPADLAGLINEDQISIIPAWTLATLFPAASQSTFHLSTGPLATQRGSELLFFNDVGEGINLAPSRRFYLTAAGWFEAGSYLSANDQVILPGQAFAVRHRTGAAATTFVPFDEVSGNIISLALPVAAGKADDAMVAPPRPTPVTLDQLDLTGLIFVESSSTAIGDRKDQLILFDATVAEMNRRPSAIYFRNGGQWKQDTTGFPSSGTTQIEPSAGLLIRKAAGTTASIPRWSNAPAYDLTTP
jgi:uncharacterized protein (TIGR02597 family)